MLISQPPPELRNQSVGASVTRAGNLPIYLMCRRAVPSALPTETPSCPTACMLCDPLSTTSSGDTGCPSLCIAHEAGSTAGHRVGGGGVQITALSEESS